MRPGLIGASAAKTNVTAVGRLVVALKEIVLDYSPSTSLLKRIIKTRDRRAAAAVG